MSDFIEKVYNPMLTECGFIPEIHNKRFNSAGNCWRLSPEIGEGYYWTYCQNNLFDIRIHDFSFHQDKIMDFNLPESLNIAYYESISGEELSPYRRLSAGCVKTFCGGEPYRIMVHKNIPIRSVCIEILPTYYDDYIRRMYPDIHFDMRKAFRQIDQTSSFHEMERLLVQVKNFAGDGIAAKLFYESKVAEALSLITSRSVDRGSKTAGNISSKDSVLLRNVTAYIDDHYMLDLPLNQLTKIACMSATKLKHNFKKYHDCTMTTYIQQKRIGQAEHLLANSDLAIGLVAKTVGYDSASRFSELFFKFTGIQPREFRRLSQQ